MFPFCVALCVVNVASADHGRVVSRPWPCRQQTMAVSSADHGRVVSRPWPKQGQLLATLPGKKKEMKNTQVEQTTAIDKDYISCAAAHNFCFLCRSLTAHASVCPAPLWRAQWLLLSASRQPGIQDLLIGQG